MKGLGRGLEGEKRGLVKGLKVLWGERGGESGNWSLGGGERGAVRKGFGRGEGGGEEGETGDEKGRERGALKGLGKGGGEEREEREGEGWWEGEGGGLRRLMNGLMVAARRTLSGRDLEGEKGLVPVKGLGRPEGGPREAA
jgi:hypothetical protein